MPSKSQHSPAGSQPRLGRLEHGSKGHVLARARGALVSLPSWARVTLAAYGVVAVFGLAYLIVSLAWSGLSSAETAAVAALIALPLALGLLWPRLTGFKAFGLEVSLAQVTVQPDTRLAVAITAPDLGSAKPELVAQVTALLDPQIELVEIDLRDGTYWWSTRLFLLAALAQDVSDVRAFVFLRGGIDRRFLGIAAPVTVRRGLAAQTPELEKTYHEVAKDAPVGDARQQVQQVVFSWTARSFGAAQMPEGDFTSRISPEKLNSALRRIGQSLDTASVEWSGYTEDRIVRGLLHDFNGDYVALLRAGSLDYIVKRRALIEDAARSL